MFRFLGIPTAVADSARATLKSPQYGHPAHLEIAGGYGPCRVCLRTFEVGREERLLFTYQPFEEPGSLPAPGPIYVHATSCPRYNGDVLPPDFRALPLVIEGYRSGSELVAQERVGQREPEAVLATVFEEAGAEYAHIRNGEAGCFMARVERRETAARSPR